MHSIEWTSEAAQGDRAIADAEVPIRRPRRVLHIVRAMNRGGAETWLMHLLRRLDPRRVKMDFLVHTAAPAAFDDEILDHDAGLIRCLESWKMPAYGREIYSMLRRLGPYDAVHSHVHHFSGYLLLLARFAGVPVRISHSHNDTAAMDSAGSLPRRGYLRLMSGLIRAHATHLVAVSSPAGKALFGPGWQRDPRARTFPCGIDLAPIQRRIPRNAARHELGIAEGELVVGHVGRFETQKNHKFLLKVAAEVVRLRPRTRFLLVGDGALRPEIEGQIQALGIVPQVMLAGQRPDVPNLLSAMDVFTLPSIYEGLPLALIEAQACGVRCVISEAVTGEADAVPDLIRRLSLDAEPSDWAHNILSIADRTKRSPADCLASVEKSRLNVTNSLETVYSLYEQRPTLGRAR